MKKKNFLTMAIFLIVFLVFSNSQGVQSSFEIPYAKIQQDLNRHLLVDSIKRERYERAHSGSDESEPIRGHLVGRQSRISDGDYISVSDEPELLLVVSPNGDVDTFAFEKVSILPEGIGYNPTNRTIVIAAVSKLIVVDLETLTFRQIFGFDYVADVAFESGGNIIAVDAGRRLLNEKRKDGVIYRMDPDGGRRRQIATSFDWVNPEYVDIAPDGKIIVLDDGAGPRLRRRSNYGAILSVDPISQHVSFIYREPGIIGTGMAVDENGSVWIGNVDDLQLFDPAAGFFDNVCLLRAGFFEFISGLAVDGLGNLIISDGVFNNPPHAILRSTPFSMGLRCLINFVASGGLVRDAIGIDVVRQK